MISKPSWEFQAARLEISRAVRRAAPAVPPRGRAAPLSRRRPDAFLGALFEGWVASEIVKAQANAGRRRELYFFRDHQGLEVDFVVPGRAGALALIEAKATRTPDAAMAGPLLRLRAALRETRRGPVHAYLVHRGAAGPTRALAPEVRAVPTTQLVELLGI